MSVRCSSQCILPSVPLPGVLDAELFQLYTPHDYEAQEQLQVSWPGCSLTSCSSS
jgi:hypothetical protein